MFGRRTVVAVAVVIVAGAVAAFFIFRNGSVDGPAATIPTGNEKTPAAERREESRQGTPRRRTRQVRVVTAKVVMRTIRNRVAAVGTGRAFRSLTVTSDVSGVIEKIAFTAGAPVKAGAELVVLESQSQTIAVRLAQVKVDEADATVKRYETLKARSAISGVQLEQAQTALAAAKAELDARQYDLSRRTIRAPFDGVMGITRLVKGDYLKDAAPIATIDDRSKLLVDFVVSERAASSIKLGQSVRATTLSFTGQVFRGTVSAIDSRIDPASRTLRVEAVLPNADNRLISGMTFSIRINIPGEERPTFPGIAIKWDREGAHVWKVGDDDKVSRVPVTIRSRTNQRVSVDAELKAGDRVVVEGLDSLLPGLKVTVVPADGQQ